MSQPRRDPGWLRVWWGFYLALAALAFAIPETVALIHPGEGGTMSEWTRDTLGVGPDGTGGAVGVGVLAVLLAAFAVWFPLHIKGNVLPWERSREDVPDQPGSG